jgi:hypothetical protein
MAILAWLRGDLDDEVMANSKRLRRETVEQQLAIDACSVVDVNKTI